MIHAFGSLKAACAIANQELGKLDAKRAEGLIQQHLDLCLAEGQRVSTDSDRVTRPLLPLYDSLPTLLSGIITLCKAQARLRELSLDRVTLEEEDWDYERWSAAGTPEAKVVASDVAEGVSTSRSSERSLAFMKLFTAKARDSISIVGAPGPGGQLSLLAL